MKKIIPKHNSLSLLYRDQKGAIVLEANLSIIAPFINHLIKFVNLVDYRKYDEPPSHRQLQHKEYKSFVHLSYNMDIFYAFYLDRQQKIQGNQVLHIWLLRHQKQDYVQHLYYVKYKLCNQQYD